MVYPPPRPATEPPPTLPYYGCPPAAAVTRFFKNYANFKGRASQQEYLWILAAGAAAGVVMAILFGIAAGATVRSGPWGVATGGTRVFLLLWLLLVFASLAVVVPFFALAWRRLHDANLPGPLIFLAWVPFVGIVVVVGIGLLKPVPGSAHYDVDGGAAAQASGLGFPGIPAASPWPTGDAFGMPGATNTPPAQPGPPPQGYPPPPGWGQPGAAPPGWGQPGAAPPGWGQPPPQAPPPGYPQPPQPPQAPPGYGQPGQG